VHKWIVSRYNAFLEWRRFHQKDRVFNYLLLSLLFRNLLITLIGQYEEDYTSTSHWWSSYFCHCRLIAFLWHHFILHSTFNETIPKCFTPDHPFKGFKGSGTLIWSKMQSWINFLAVGTCTMLQWHGIGIVGFVICRKRQIGRVSPL